MKRKEYPWKLKVVIIFLVLLPSFIGYPFSLIQSKHFFLWTMLSNAPNDGTLLYLFFSCVMIRLSAGVKTFVMGLKVAGFLAISVVFVGAFIAYIKMSIFTSGIDDFSSLSMYYVNRLINIMTVVPLSVSFFMVIPFDDIEHNIVTSSVGIALWKKCVLMISRVVNNIRFSVMPDIFMIMSEERYKGFIESGMDEENLNPDVLRVKIYKFLKRSLYVAASGIAFSLEYIPLWAYEISRIPNLNGAKYD
jgi:hypothetical protein